MNTALEQLEHWIEQYKRINGTPPINEVLAQIDLLKDYEKEQCNIDLVSESFTADDVQRAYYDGLNDNSDLFNIKNYR